MLMYVLLLRLCIHHSFLCEVKETKTKKTNIAEHWGLCHRIVAQVVCDDMFNLRGYTQGTHIKALISLILPFLKHKYMLQ